MSGSDPLPAAVPVFPLSGALLEADDLAERAATLTALMTFAHGTGNSDRPTLQ